MQRIGESPKDWIVLVILNLCAFVYLIQIPNGPGRVEDFSAFYSAGTVWREVSPHAIYDLQLQFAVQQRVFGKAGLSYFHPPFELLVYTPLSLLSYRVALWCWRLVCLILLGVASYFIKRLDVTGLSAKTVLLIALAFFPVVMCLAQGQDSILLLALLTASAYLYSLGQDNRAGCVLALALFKPQFILPIVFVLAIRRRWKLVSSFLAASVGVVLVNVAILGKEGMRQLISVTHFAESRAEIGVVPGMMPNLRGFLGLILTNPALATVVTMLISAVLLLSVASSDAMRERSLHFPAAICVAAVVSFHMYVHDMTILLLPIVAVLARLRPGEYFRTFVVFALLCTPLYWVASFRLSLYALPIMCLLWLMMRRTPEVAFSEASAHS